MKITATLETTIFSNNNFMIGRFYSPDQQPFTALGNMTNPQPDMDYCLFGEWEENQKYGKQFRFERYHIEKPQDEDGIYRYLVRHAKYVGPKIATRIIEEYGDQTLVALKCKPEYIAAKIKGITIEKATEISNELKQEEATEAVKIGLYNILKVPGLRKSLPEDLINEYGSDAAEMIKKDPYILCQFRGTGFLMADRVALNVLQIDKNHSMRIRAGVLYVINQNMQEGSVWMRINDILEKVQKLSIDNLKLVTATIDRMTDFDGLLVRCDNFYALPKSDENETRIAKGILNAIECETIG
jgi:exodeoxyribonuclease V alpha subunit